MAKVQREASETTAATSASPITEEEIRLRAYALYLDRGSENGHDLEDWLEAERSLKEERSAA